MNAAFRAEAERAGTTGTSHSSRPDISTGLIYNRDIGSDERVEQSDRSLRVGKWSVDNLPGRRVS